MTVYRFTGKLNKADPEVVAKELSRINERDGRVKPQTVVDESRPDDAPLHAEFEWDDYKAAEGYRRGQASRLIRDIRVVKQETEDGEEVLERVFIHVPSELLGAQGEYQSIVRVMSDADMRQAAIADALAFISRARSRLQEFKELERQYLALEKIENDLVDTQMKIVRRERAQEQTQRLVAV